MSYFALFRPRDAPAVLFSLRAANQAVAPLRWRADEAPFMVRWPTKLSLAIEHCNNQTQLISLYPLFEHFFDRVLLGRS